MKAMILTVIFVTSFLRIANADPPVEISEQLKTPGQVLTVRTLQYDFDLKHIILAKHQHLFIFAYPKWNGHMWIFEDKGILEVFILVNQKPHILWSTLPLPSASQ